MASRESSDLAARADVLVCQGAVLLLRARRNAGVAGEDVARDVDRLLTAASLEFELVQSQLSQANEKTSDPVRPRISGRPRNEHRFRSRSDVAGLSRVPVKDPFEETRRAQ